jgi:hypothetical protein
MTTPRVPHDPKDLREAAKVIRACLKAPDWRLERADRLEAWADDLERPAIPTASVATLRDAARWHRMTAVGERDASLQNAVYQQAGRLEVLADRMERLDPLEAAVLDAAKAWADMHDGTWPSTDDIFATHDALRDAVRALQEATDA